jgi:hypothetical protein
MSTQREIINIVGSAIPRYHFEPPRFFAWKTKTYSAMVMVSNAHIIYGCSFFVKKGNTATAHTRKLDESTYTNQRLWGFTKRFMSIQTMLGIKSIYVIISAMNFCFMVFGITGVCEKGVGSFVVLFNVGL